MKNLNQVPSPLSIHRKIDWKSGWFKYYFKDKDDGSLTIHQKKDHVENLLKLSKWHTLQVFPYKVVGFNMGGMRSINIKHAPHIIFRH